MTSATELAWCAGFFDGEGSFTHSHGGRYIRAYISQKTPALLLRFQVAVGGFGTVSRKSARDCWQFYTTTPAQVDLIAELLWPYLGDNKKTQYTLVKERQTLLQSMNKADRMKHQGPSPKKERI